MDNPTITAAWALDLLRAVPRHVVGGADFLLVWEQLVDQFDGHPAQQDLTDAYDIVTGGAADAEQDLQEIVERNSEE